jgi:hypothetical protein
MLSRASLLAQAWRISRLPSARRFEHALEDPGGIQRDLLESLIERNEKTAFGQLHGFRAVRGAESFRSLVPFSRWDDVRPWVERIRSGEQNVLTCDRVTRLVPTGGSSGGAKLIPWTRGLAADFSHAIGPWIVDLHRQFPRALSGPAYWSVSPLAQRNPDNSQVAIGFDDDSSYVGGILGPLLSAAFAVPSNLRFASDVESFRYATLRCLLACRNLALISVWHPSFLSLLLKAAMPWRDRLIADIAEGRMSAALPASITTTLRLRADPRRAAQLRSCDWDDMRSLWPNLAVVSCWADGAAAGPCAALHNELSGIPIQPKGLLATEGVITIPWRKEHVLAVRSHVHEFIDAHGSAHWADELVAGESYEIALTTNGGLYRYLIGDRVRVVGFTARTPCLRFIGRGELVVDLCGEKLDEAFVGEILQRLLGRSARFALLAPDYQSDSAGYTLYTDATLPGLASELDRELSANPQYRLARTLGQLAVPRTFRVDDDASAIYLDHMGKRGARLGDVKPLALSPETHWSKRFSGGYS